MDSFDLKVLLGVIGGTLLILGGLLWCLVKADEAEQQECHDRGGHIIYKSAYKSSVSFCISADGRILD